MEAMVLAPCPFLRDRRKMMAGKRVMVVCEETGKKYSSITQASRDSGVAAASICRASMTGSTAGGTHWMRLSPSRGKGCYALQSRAVQGIISERCNDEGVAVISMSDFSSSLGLSKERIRQILRSLKREKRLEDGPNYAENGARLPNWYRLVKRDDSTSG